MVMVRCALIHKMGYLMPELKPKPKRSEPEKKRTRPWAKRKGHQPKAEKPK